MFARCLLVGTLLFTTVFGQSTFKASSEGRLTVTATVTSSVAVLFGPDGEQTIVVYNAPADQAGLLLACTTHDKTAGAQGGNHHEHRSDARTHKGSHKQSR